MQEILASNVSSRNEPTWLAGDYSTRTRVIRSDMHSATTNTPKYILSYIAAHKQFHLNQFQYYMFYLFKMTHLVKTTDWQQAVPGLEANSVYLLNISKQERQRERERERGGVCVHVCVYVEGPENFTNCITGTNKIFPRNANSSSRSK